MSKVHIALSLTMSVIFGMGWVLGKSALGHFPPILLAAFRFGITAAIVYPLVKRPKVGLGTLLLVSALAVSIPYSLFYIGLRDLDVSQTILLVQLEAPVLTIFGSLFLKDRPSALTWMGIGLAVLGVVPMAGVSLVEGNAMAFVLVISSIMVWATGQTVIRSTGAADSIGLIGSLSMLATPQLFVLSLLFEDGQLLAVTSAGIGEWSQVIYLGVVMTGFGIGIWYYLVGKYPGHVVGPYLLLVPVITIGGGVLFLGETLSAGTLAGGLVIIVGVALAVCGQIGPSS